MSLDVSPSEFKELLEKTTALVLEQHKDIESRKAYHHYSQAQFEQWFDEPLPLEGMDNFDLLDEVKKKVLATATGNLGPHMYGYVVSGGNQIAILAEKLAATINQNLGKWHLGPACNEIEKRVIQWGAQMIGFCPTAGGVLLSGGSAANLAGLTVARNIFFERLGLREKGLFGQKPFTVYASSEVHGCIDKSMELLGIGSEQLRKIKTDPEFRIDLEALEQQIEEDIQTGFEPFCIVGNAGTVNTGAIDDLNGLSDIAKTRKLWFHVDGAYGGLAAALPSIESLYSGMKNADSIAIDFHKWLYQPFEAGCLLVNDWDTLRRAYSKQADYLATNLEEDSGRMDFHDHYFQLSRNAKAFKVWMSFKSFGTNRILKMIQNDIDLTHYLADEIDASSDFELMSRSSLAIACFRYRGNLTSNDDIVALNERLIPALENDGRVFITGTKLNGEFVLRACLINHRKTEQTVDYLLNTIRDVATKIQLAH